MENTRHKVAAVIGKLADLGIACDLFGGWAEEVLCLRAPSAHGDIDLLYRSESFEEFDVKLTAMPDFEEVPLKRFRHKRAFNFDGTLCEIILVQERETPLTLFWGNVSFYWESPLLHDVSLNIAGQGISVVSAKNLKRYRLLHHETQPHRWRDPHSLEP
ncbi:hypothetical protein [Oryzifoliimicrobium ureilyticus]|uniref:hypothetical protein n=1 Tax=Oryzifoliimicrobium ureilyticus TaxID=3113724 RepID=UPI0030766163